MNCKGTYSAEGYRDGRGFDFNRLVVALSCSKSLVTSSVTAKGNKRSGGKVIALATQRLTNKAETTIETILHHLLYFGSP